MTQVKPIALVPACNRMLGAHPFHVAGRKYLEAVRLAGAIALVVGRAEPGEFDALLDLADGVLLSGSPSNVHPDHYGQALHDPALPQDRERDDWVLGFVDRVLARGVPLLAICRGAQEVNVALGGSLHQAVHEAGPFTDHRARSDDPVEVQYGPAHDVIPVPGTPVARITGGGTLQVNSIHGQGIARLGEGLVAAAHAPDGLVEAFYAPAAPGFNLCVQWHPEWQAADNPDSVRLFEAFGRAMRQHRLARASAPLPR